MAVVSMKELLEAGVHFGHQTRRWNPKMKRFIFTERGGIYIIDLQQTQQLVEDAYDFARNIAERGGTILFVGTKKQAQDAVRTEATRVGMPFVANRWLGGLLTNWRTIQDRIAYLHDLRRLKNDGQLALLPAKERITMEAELEKLEANLGGVADMKRQPDAIFIVDLKKEALAVREAQRLHLPVIAIVDTNCDPDEAQFVIPGNDDAIRSCSLIVRALADGIAAGQSKVSEKDFAAKAAAAETAAATEAAEAAAAAAAEPTEPMAEESRAPAQTGEIIEIEGIGPAFADKLGAAGVATIDALLEKGATPEGRSTLVEETGIDAVRVLRWVNHADLIRVVGVDPQFAELLEAAGVDSVPELAQRNVDNLVTGLAETNEARHLVGRVPSADEVADWIEQAKALPRIVAH
ncbi:30S ribosomal protein S2 [Gaiella sp.]|uniref:30S ribosomal protein S2 n=1 Tax=Gaiella sp. TaxID=2663207 RepID=UPI003264EECF